MIVGDVFVFIIRFWMQDMNVFNNDAFQVTRYDSWIVVGILCCGIAIVFGIGGWWMVYVFN